MRMLNLTWLAVQEEWRGEVIEVSWSPRAFLFKGFLSEEEADHLIGKVTCAVAAASAQLHMPRAAACSGCPGRLGCAAACAVTMLPGLRWRTSLAFAELAGGLCWAQARPNMVKSTVVDNDTGKSIDSTVRTSTGTFFGREVARSCHALRPAALAVADKQPAGPSGKRPRHVMNLISPAAGGRGHQGR